MELTISNIKKIIFRNSQIVNNSLHAMGLREINKNLSLREEPLRTNQYKWDKACPLFISCLPANRRKFESCKLIKNFCFIEQVRNKF